MLPEIFFTNVVRYSDIFPNLHRPHLSPSSMRPENCSVSSFMKCLQQCCSSWCSDPSCLSHTCYYYHYYHYYYYILLLLLLLMSHTWHSSS